MAMVEPCRKSAASAKRVPALSTPCEMPSTRRLGVVSVLPRSSCPLASSNAATSVKVPPMSAASRVRVFFKRVSKGPSRGLRFIVCCAEEEDPIMVRYFTLLFSWVTGALLAGGAVAQTELKFADALPKTFSYYPAAVAFKEAVDKCGKLTIKLFPEGVLGDQKALMEATKVGSIDISVVASQVSQQLVPEHGVFGLPFVWIKHEEYLKFLQGPISAELGKKMEPHGLKVLLFADGGSLAVLNSKRPVKTPDDMKGLKLRVMQDPMQVDMIKAMGGIPVPMGTPEVYSAIQQGQIDGNATSVQLLYGLKNQEVAKQLSVTNHGRAAAVVVMNLRKWNSLGAEQKKALDEG